MRGGLALIQPRGNAARAFPPILYRHRYTFGTGRRLAYRGRARRPSVSQRTLLPVSRQRATNLYVGGVRVKIRSEDQMIWIRTIRRERSHAKLSNQAQRRYVPDPTNIKLVARQNERWWLARTTHGSIGITGSTTCEGCFASW